MKAHYLAPIFDKQSDVEAFKAEIVRLLRSEVFSPLVKAAKNGDLLSKIDSVSPEDVAKSLDTTPAYNRIAKHIDLSFRRSGFTLQNAKKRQSLALSPKLSKAETQRLHAEYTDNSRTSILDFLHECLSKLRKDVQQHVTAGGRQEDLAKRLRTEWGMAERKAEFIARNETSRLSAKLKEVRYAAAGIDEYDWICVTGTATHPVRHMHEALNGTRQRFSAPPVVNPQGQRKHPGEDWNCRCYARPVVTF